MKIITVILTIIQLSSAFAVDHLAHMRHHLNQASDDLWRATESETKVWSQWLKQSKKDNQKRAKAWLRERVDHL